MGSLLLKQAMAPEVLDQTWRRLRREHTPWSIHVSRDQLQQHLLKHILECRSQVLSGRYRPQPLRQFPLQKPDGKQRVLSAQYLKDKFVQRALLIVLEPRSEAIFHNDSFAYRPGRSVAMALEKVRERVRVGQAWLVDADISKFFDTIPHRQLVKVLKGFINDSPAMRLIEKWLSQGAHHRSLLRSPRGISQGAILSPLFCNLYLHTFDMAMTNANIPFVRFADDFLLFSEAKQDAVKARRFAREVLEDLGLGIHPEKTRIVRSGPSVIFLGERLPNPR
jgi:group II intron reverse transcriptase/maturase